MSRHVQVAFPGIDETRLVIRVEVVIQTHVELVPIRVVAVAVVKIETADPPCPAIACHVQTVDRDRRPASNIAERACRIRKIVRERHPRKHYALNPTVISRSIRITRRAIGQFEYVERLRRSPIALGGLTGLPFRSTVGLIAVAF